MTGQVYITPAGTLVLLVGKDGGNAVVLHLDDGDVRVLSRSIHELVKHGWRVWSEAEEERGFRVNRFVKGLL